MNHVMRSIVCYVIGLLAAALAINLLMGTIHYAGYQLPDQLDQLATQAQQEGYQLKPDVPRKCVPQSEVSETDKTTVKTVTGQDIKTCRFADDSMHKDAILGALLFLAVCATLGLLAWAARSENDNIALIVFVASVTIAVLLGFALHDTIVDWYHDWHIITVIFWHGFFAAMVVSIGAVIAVISHASMEPAAELE